jgi:hypothetical protein
VPRSRLRFLVLERPVGLLPPWRILRQDVIAARVLFAGFVVWLCHARGYPGDTDVNRAGTRASPRSISTATSPNAATTAKK